jgi:hypothetical protein
MRAKRTFLAIPCRTIVTFNVSRAGSQQLGRASRNMDTAERNGKSDPVADISPDGDVVLVVGPRNVRLRIHSQCLRCASKVFGAMFGPHWSEGQGLSKVLELSRFRRTCGASSTAGPMVNTRLQHAAFLRFG